MDVEDERRRISSSIVRKEIKDEGNRPKNNRDDSRRMIPSRDNLHWNIENQSKEERSKREFD